MSTCRADGRAGQVRFSLPMLAAPPRSPHCIAIAAPPRSPRRLGSHVVPDTPLHCSHWPLMRRPVAGLSATERAVAALGCRACAERSVQIAIWTQIAIAPLHRWWDLCTCMCPERALFVGVAMCLCGCRQESSVCVHRAQSMRKTLPLSR